MDKIQPTPAAHNAAASSAAGSPTAVPGQLASRPPARPLASNSNAFAGSSSALPSVIGGADSWTSSYLTDGSSSSNEFSFLSAIASSCLSTRTIPPSGRKTANSVSCKRLLQELVLSLYDDRRRDDALSVLTQRKEMFQDLAPVLWFSFGSIAILMQEIIIIYPLLSSPSLTLPQIKRVLNVLTLFQGVASHADTRKSFIRAYIPYYFYPFLGTTSMSVPLDYLRVCSLGVIGALVKFPDTDVVHFLLSSEIMPLLLHSMEIGSELPKTVATFIVQKILLDNLGLEYVCCVPERLIALSRSLAKVVDELRLQPSARLLKHVIRCYFCLSQDERSILALRYLMPTSFLDGTFNRFLGDLLRFNPDLVAGNTSIIISPNVDKYRIAKLARRRFLKIS